MFGIYKCSAYNVLKTIVLPPFKITDIETHILIGSQNAIQLYSIESTDISLCSTYLCFSFQRSQIN